MSRLKVQRSPEEGNVSRLEGQAPYLATQFQGELEEAVEGRCWHAGVAGRSDDCIVGFLLLLCEESWPEGTSTSV